MVLAGISPAVRADEIGCLDTTFKLSESRRFGLRISF